MVWYSNRSAQVLPRTSGETLAPDPRGSSQPQMPKEDLLSRDLPHSLEPAGSIPCAANHVVILAIGSGHSLGPEDPSLQIGAGLASAVGTRLNLSRKNMRILAPVGAAAGLAAAFNAPISAVLFVIEEVIGHWTAGILGSVVLAAVSSVVVMRWFLGSESLFRIPPVELKHPSELIAYSILGIAGGLASVAFASGIGALR